MASKFSWLLTLVKFGTMCIFGGIAIVCAVILYLSPTLPSVDQLRDVRLQTPLKVFSANGKLIGEFGEQKRTPIDFEQIPPQFIHAILSAEDDNFFNHHGVDPVGLLRAGSQILTSGEIQSGGSTITMQVARNFFLTRKQTFTRKFNEILLALEIEHELSKEEILELYANKIYLGKRAYGIQAAANIYYGADISTLNLAQFAMIAGLPKAPSAYNPINNPQRALIRRDWILGRMHLLGYITQEEMEHALAEPISAGVYGDIANDDAPYVSEMVRAEMLELFGPSAYEDGYEVITTIDVELQNAARNAVKTGLMTYDARHGYRGPETQFPKEDIAEAAQLDELLAAIPSVTDIVPAVVTEVMDTSAIIYVKGQGNQELTWENGLSTSRKLRTQNWRGELPKSASDVVEIGDLVRVQLKGDDWHFSQIPNAQAAMVAIDPNTGAIKALQGGLNFFHNRFNRITSAKRQPGSNLKPFLYTSALENNFTAATSINDAPIVFEDATLEGIWRPENDSGQFYGPTRLREALYYSRNIVSIRILRELGLNTARATMERFGFDDSELAKNLTLALGSEALPPLKVAAGYTAFANGGYKVEPYFIDEIKDQSGNIIYKSLNPRICLKCSEQTLSDDNHWAEEKAVESVIWNLPEPKNTDAAEYSYPNAERILDERVHFIIDSILKDVITKGTGRRALSLERTDLAGKTGTTNGPRDAWFSGYSPHLVATAWVGFDDNSELGNNEFGGTAALPIWVEFMETALKNKPEIHFDQPPGLVIARVDPKTGERAAPSSANAIFEYFLRENTPAELNTEQALSEENPNDINNIF